MLKNTNVPAPGDVRLQEMLDSEVQELIKQEARTILHLKSVKNQFGSVNFQHQWTSQIENDTYAILECASLLRQGFNHEQVYRQALSGKEKFTVKHFEEASDLLDRIVKQDLDSGALTKIKLRIIQDQQAIAVLKPKHLERLIENGEENKNFFPNETQEREEVHLAAEHYAMSIGDLNQVEQIRQGNLTEKQLQDILIKGRNLELDFDDDVLKGEDEQVEYEQLKKEVQLRLEKQVPGQEDPFDFKKEESQSAQNDEKTKIDLIYNLVENIDKNYQHAKELQVTDVQFFDILRKVTADKYEQIKKVETLFHNRVKLLHSAKNYEIRCERHLAIESARKFVQEFATNTSKKFAAEAATLRGQFLQAVNLLESYDQRTRKLNQKLEQQEQIIQKLSTSLFFNDVDRKAYEMAEQELGLQKRLQIVRFEPDEEKPYLSDPFEFYGGSFELSEIEKKRAIRDQLYKAQEIQLKELSSTVESLVSENRHLTIILQDTDARANMYKEKLKEAKRQLNENQEEFRITTENKSYEFSHRLDRVMKCAQEISNQFRLFKKLTLEEFRVKDQIQISLKENFADNEALINCMKKILLSKNLSMQFMRAKEKQTLNEESFLELINQIASMKKSDPNLLIEQQKNLNSAQKDDVTDDYQASLVTRGVTTGVNLRQDALSSNNISVTHGATRGEVDCSIATDTLTSRTNQVWQFLQNPVMNQQKQNQAESIKFMPLQNNAFKFPMTASHSGRMSISQIESGTQLQKHKNLIQRGTSTLEEINEMVHASRTVMTAVPPQQQSHDNFNQNQVHIQHNEHEKSKQLPNLRFQHSGGMRQISPSGTLIDERARGLSQFEPKMPLIFGLPNHNRRNKNSHLRSTTIDSSERKKPVIAKEIVELATTKNLFKNVSISIVNEGIHRTNQSVFDTIPSNRHYMAQKNFVQKKANMNSSRNQANYPSVTQNNMYSEYLHSDSYNGYRSLDTTQERSSELNPVTHRGFKHVNRKDDLLIDSQTSIRNAAHSQTDSTSFVLIENSQFN